VNITVNVDGDVDLTAVVGEHYDGDRECHVPQTLGDLVADRLVQRLIHDRESEYRNVAREVADTRRDIIRELVTAEVETALTNPVIPTNSWGESTGEPTTLRAEIVRIARESVRVRKPNTVATRDESAVELLIRKEISGALAKELADVVAAEKAKVVALVHAKAAELIADAVKAGVRS
jgi:hypothetical protein